MTLRYQHLMTAVDETSVKGQKHKPFKIMEIGCFHGIQGKLMANRAYANGRKNIEYYGFDLFEDMTHEVSEVEGCRRPFAPSYSEVMDYLKGKAKVKAINLFKGDSKKTLPEAVKKLPKMDVIFIDGGKSLATVQSDIEYAIKLTGEDSVILVDGYYASSHFSGCAFLVINELVKRSGLKVEILEPVDAYPEFGLSVQMVKITKTGTLDTNESVPGPEFVVPKEEPKTEVENVEQPCSQPGSSCDNPDLQSPGLCTVICKDSSCEYAKQHCDGSRRCESGVGFVNLELPTAGPVDNTQVSSERPEPDQELELGTSEGKGTENTDSGTSEQRLEVSEELVDEDISTSKRKSRRPRRSRNKRSGASSETADNDLDS
jgi:hypothetical protein